MKKKALVLSLFLMLLLTPHIGQALSFSYVTGSLIKDRRYGLANCIIEEGYYFLVIDNTGVVTGDYDRNDSFVIYTMSFTEEGLDPLEGSVTVAEENYFVISFNFELTGVYVTECSIEIRGSNGVSVFITDYLGLAEYYDEVGRIDIDVRRQLIYTIVGVGGALAIGIGVATFFVLRKIRRQDSVIKDLLSGKVREEDDEKQRNVA
ncbi:MAG: hypothetical protein KAS47_06770 [Candidatus Heimdallarchaeota archaeon]|nr:hypothetical protein [Candidatus Heimdallarchaeota archaeon]